MMLSLQKWSCGLFEGNGAASRRGKDHQFHSDFHLCASYIVNCVPILPPQFVAPQKANFPNVIVQGKRRTRMRQKVPSFSFSVSLSAVLLLLLLLLPLTSSFVPLIDPRVVAAVSTSSQLSSVQRRYEGGSGCIPYVCTS